MGGALTRTRNNGEDTGDSSSHSAYRYPPKTGSYFGSHFIMGGERFESPQPGEYLFGDSEELNFLGNKPVPFPYPVPSGSDPTKTLKSLVYIRKDSLRLVKSPALPTDGGGDGAMCAPYNVEFIFDSDVKCSIRIHYFATEELINGQIVYHAKESAMTSEVYHYKRGAGQAFSQASHTIQPAKYPEEDWQYTSERDVYPIAIHCTVEEEEHAGHAHITYAVVEKSSEGSSYSIKPLKQKQVVDGLTYLIQEIYGIENKNMESIKDMDPDDEVSDSGAECVICMSDMRDTLILPCRHLCLCSTCADSLRYQASMCPICRVKFRALLQIRAMRKKVAPSNTSPQSDADDTNVNQEGVPPGYEAISLIEALNGQVVPPVSNEGVHLQITGPPALFSVEKKGQKDNKITVTGPIEYQKEMDTSTDKESSKGTLEKKKEKDKVLDTTTDVASTDADATPEEVVPRKLSKESKVPVPAPLKSTVVTVRCSSNGSIRTETKLSPDQQSPVSKPSHIPQRGVFKTKIEVSRLAGGLSTGDMADDEREDSSEPEADYEMDEDDDLDPTAAADLDLPPTAARSSTGSLTELPASSPHTAVDMGDGGKLPGADSGDNFPTSLAVSLGDLRGGSGTEGSSFGSNSSSHALLTPGNPALAALTGGAEAKGDDSAVRGSEAAAAVEKLMQEPLNTDL